ncbi:MAG: putative capsid protein [Circoviridae sp.]|nr:MAG: putative capsid protein [Circoviridae sp.]
MPRRNKSKVKGLTKTQQKSVKKIAKEVAMAIPERKVFGFQAENQQLIHNKVAYLDSWLKCKQGTADPDDLSAQLVRIGDEVMLRNINVRFWLSNKEDRPNCMYKLYLFWYDSGMTLSDAYCYFTQTNKMLDRVNDENISVIDQQTIFSGPSYSGTQREHSYLATLKASWKGKKITYDEGGAIPKKRDLGTMVVCYDAYGTLQSDNIASYAYNGIVTIQDA